MDGSISERLARTLAGLALIQRTLKDGDKLPIEKKIVCKVSIDKMLAGGEPTVNMLVIPVIMGYVLVTLTLHSASSISTT